MSEKTTETKSTAPIGMESENSMFE